jgi:hypothetical protein
MIYTLLFFHLTFCSAKPRGCQHLKRAQYICSIRSQEDENQDLLLPPYHILPSLTDIPSVSATAAGDVELSRVDRLRGNDASCIHILAIQKCSRRMSIPASCLLADLSAFFRWSPTFQDCVYLFRPCPPLALLPRLPLPFVTYPGFSFPWELKHKGLFEKFKCDTVSLCPGDGRALLFTADVPFITEMSSFAWREVFPKPIEEYKVLSYLGSNLVICEGESWRR